MAYFYHMLRPYEHFVPFWVHNSSDILQAVQWLKDHDSQAQQIAANAERFASR